jgi:hypothetical protein
MNTVSRSAELRSSDCRDHKRSSRSCATRVASIVVLVTVLLTAPPPARAVDGCVVLLCLAAPSWRAIPQCVPPIRQLFRDLARGKSFPTCAMSSGGNSASHGWSAAPTYCPPQYTRTWDGPHGPVYTCDYDGAISVTVNGEPFARTWWSMTGESVTDFSPSAKRQLGAWDSRFDAEYATWLATRPTVPTEPAR